MQVHLNPELLAWLIFSILLLTFSYLTQRQITLNIEAICEYYGTRSVSFLDITISDRFEEGIRAVAYLAALAVGIQALLGMDVWVWLLIANLGVLAINSGITYIRNQRRLKYWTEQADIIAIHEQKHHENIPHAHEHDDESRTPG